MVERKRLTYLNVPTIRRLKRLGSLCFAVNQSSTLMICIIALVGQWKDDMF